MAKNKQGGGTAVAVIATVVIVAGIGFALTQDFKTGHNRLLDYGQAVGGSPEAEYRQALKLQDSRVLGDAGKAQAWFEKAAAQGHVKSMLALGDLHNASKTEADGDMAVAWYEKAAAAGNVEAMRKLGICYSIGRGRAEPDQDKALAQFAAAAKTGDAQGERLYGLQLNLMGRPDGEAWLLKAADQGDVGAYAGLGDLYYRSFNKPGHAEAAYTWLGKAAEAGDMESQLTYSYMFFAGHGVKKDRAEAYKWVAIANDTGLQKPRSALAYLEGKVSDAEIAEGRTRAEAWRKSHKK